MRFVLRVKGRSEYDGNDTWIGPPGYWTKSAPGEWPVSYRGTSAKACGGIQKDGYDPKKSNRQLFGPSIYCSPDLEKVSEWGYAQEFECNGKYYKVAYKIESIQRNGAIKTKKILEILIAFVTAAWSSFLQTLIIFNTGVAHGKIQNKEFMTYVLMEF